MDDLRGRVAAVRDGAYERTGNLSRLCEFLLVHWPLYAALCLAFGALCFLPALLPLVGILFGVRWWWTLLTAVVAPMVLLPLIYMLHPLPPSPGWRFSRQPLSDLGRAEVVMADTSLLTDGRRELLLALPLEPIPELRKQPEAFALSAAMAYTARLQNKETAAVLLEAAKALGIRPDNLMRLRPVEGKTWLGEIPGVIVRDGKEQSAYFVGDPGALAALCAGIDGHRPRAITEAERECIRASCQSLRQQGGLPLGFAMQSASLGGGGPIYLGMLSMRDVVSDEAAQAVRALLDAGYSLQTQPIDEAFPPPMRLAALRQRLGLVDVLYAPQVFLSTTMLSTRELCIAAADHRHRRFDAPLLLAREWFGKLAAWLRIALGVALPLLLACALGPAHPLCCLAVCALLTTALLSAASDDRRWDAAGLALLGVALLLRLFLLFAPGVAAGAAMGLFAVVAALTVSLHLSRRWQTTLICAAAGVIIMLVAWLAPGLSLLGGLLALLAGALAGVCAGQLLRLP